MRLQWNYNYIKKEKKEKAKKFIYIITQFEQIILWFVKIYGWEGEKYLKK